MEQDGHTDSSATRARAASGDSEAALRYLAELAGLITALTGRFVNLGAQTLDAETTRALREIGEFARVDRSYVFQFSEDGARVTCTHEWCAPGIAPAINNIQDTPVETFEWAMTRIKRGEVLYVENVSDLPPQAASVRAELERQDIQSLINLPLVCAGKVLGFVGFDSVRRRQIWTSEHIKLLKVVGEIIAGTIERTRATAALRRQAELETLVAQISTRFINVPVQTLGAEMDHALAAIGRFTRVDRSYLFQFEDGGRAMSNTHEWCAPGIEPHFHRLQHRSVDAFEYSMSRMRRGEVFYVPDVSRLPPPAAAERAEFEAEDIATLITVPLMVRGAMAGFLGFDAVRARKAWSEDDIRLLKLVAEVFANALDRTRTEEQLQASLQEKEVLLREVHHRVKNNLQIVASLLYLQAKASRHQLGAAALEAFGKSQNRIKSMAAVHERLYRAPDLSSIDCGAYLHGLVPDLLDTFSARDRIRVHIDSDGMHLSVEQAIPCGLIVNELLTNCIKHAFPGGRRGTVEVRLRGTPDGSRELCVADDGIGFPQDQQQDAAALGLTLVGDLASQLDGRVVVERNGGTRVRVIFPQAPARK